MSSYKRYLLAITMALFFCIVNNPVKAQSCNYTNYTLSPSGNVCSTSVTITMSGSQVGVTYQLQNPATGTSNPTPGTGAALSWPISNVISGVPYTVVATAGTCPATTVASTTINYESNVAGGIITAPNGTSLCSGGSVLLTVQPTVPGSDYTYQWFYNGAPQNNTNTQSYLATQPGSYFAVISNTCSGSQLSPVTVTAGGPVSVLSAFTGSSNLTAGTTTTAYTASAVNATNYTWTILPSYAGTISGNGTTGTVTWNTGFGGIATIGVTAFGCNGTSVSGNYPVAYNAGNYNFNSIQETDVRTPNITTTAGLSGLAIGQVDITNTYFDGLGRPIQTVLQGASGSSVDIIQPASYDLLGRQVFKYLPYSFSTGTAGSYRYSALVGSSGYSTSDQRNFYQTNATDHVNTPYPSAQSVFELSPLSRTRVQGAAGADWQVGNNHTLSSNYNFNNAIAWSSNPATSMQVALYTATINSDGSRTLGRAAGNTATYNTNQLTVTITEDENYTPSQGRAGTTEEYKDILGHVVLKRTYNSSSGVIQVLSTYYVYDINGNLAFVLTPGSSPDLTTGIPSQTLLNNFCYQYQYDQRNRLIQKRLPGKDWEYMVYNSVDQVVATQDANQRSLTTPIWLFNKYDAMGRVIVTGVWNNGGTAITRPALQALINGFAGTLWETPATTGNGYTDTAWPATPTYVLTINYYDNYNFPGNPYGPWSASATNPTGLLTASKVGTLNADGTYGTMLWRVNYYDDLGRTIQTFKQHYLLGVTSNSNYDETSISYDFANEVTNTIMQHFTTASTTVPHLTVGNAYYYDNEGRKTQTWEAITVDANPPSPGFLLSQTDYNEIGQVKTKHLHQKTDGTFFQNISYTYNERGWLKTSSAPLFTMQLNYNDGTSPQYNGNISNQLWGTPGSLTKNYAYRYDNLNRLVSGIASTGNTEKSIVYDNMGNITGLQRYLNSTEADALKYNYLSGTNPTNQLQSITDSTTNDAGMKHGTYTYGYDGNGNMTTDNSKGLTIAYNLLNLPRSNTITGTAAGTISYIYDADGTKLRRVSTQGTGSSTDYIDGIEYDATGTNAPTITFVQTEEGRALPNGSTWNYEYSLADHLGDSRLSFDTGTGTARTEQQDDYMPFGMDISVGTIGSPPNYYLYNKKELQLQLGLYDYGARFYDPVIGRWTSVDPLAETSRRLSPYNYGENNPISNIDPDGKETVDEIFARIESSLGNLDKEHDEYNNQNQTGGYGTPPNSQNGEGDGINWNPDGSNNPDGFKPPWQHGGGFGPGNDKFGVITGKTGESSGQDETGSYTITFENGKKYHGKGSQKRAEQSAKERGAANGGVKNVDWSKSENNREAFKDEDSRMQTDEGGHKSPNNVNERASPGKKYKMQDAIQTINNASAVAEGIEIVGGIMEIYWPVLLVF